MAESARAAVGTVDGLEVEAEVPLYAATLRYFAADGPFAVAVAAVTGTPLPAPLTATVLPEAAGAGAGVVLAWLRPTETLALCYAAAPLAGLTERLATAAGGHVVELSGGLEAIRVRGARLGELLSRLGGAGVGLRLNDARRGRLADVPVLAVCVHAGETLLVVDRAHAGHLLGWIQATLADWT
jgi:hypothetical protein